MSSRNEPASGVTSDHKITITRTFDAPRDLVWRAWTEPERLMRWYCPADFTVLFAENDLRVGGTWRSGMRSPDGREYIHHGQYRHIDEPRQLVFTHAWEKNDLEPPARTLVTVTLTETDGGRRTTMVFKQVGFATAESGRSHHGGWSGAFDNLARLVSAGEPTT